MACLTALAGGTALTDLPKKNAIEKSPGSRSSGVSTVSATSARRAAFPPQTAKMRAQTWSSTSSIVDVLAAEESPGRIDSEIAARLCCAHRKNSRASSSGKSPIVLIAMSGPSSRLRMGGGEGGGGHGGRGGGQDHDDHQARKARDRRKALRLVCHEGRKGRLQDVAHPSPPSR